MFPIVRTRSAIAHGAVWVYTPPTTARRSLPPRHWQNIPGVTYPPTAPTPQPPSPTPTVTIASTPPSPEHWLPIEQAAQLIGVPLNTARVYINQQRIRSIFCAPRAYYNRADIEAYLTRRANAIAARTPPPGWVTCAEAARILRLSFTSTRKYANQGRIRTMRSPDGHKLWFLAEDARRIAQSPRTP